MLSGLAETPDSITDDEVGALVLLLGVVRDAPDFGYSRELAYQLLGKIGSEMAVEVLALCILEQRHYEARPDWKDRLALLRMEVPSLFEGRADVRERVYSAIEDVGCSASATLRSKKIGLELLEWMAIPGKMNDGLTGDRANSAAQAARDAALKVSACLAALVS